MRDNIVADEIVGTFNFNVIDLFFGEMLDFFDAIPGGLRSGLILSRDFLPLAHMHDFCPKAVVGGYHIIPTIT